MEPTVFIGRLHPLVLHFPIALLLMAAGIEVLRLRMDRPPLRYCVTLLLMAGAAGAVAASATGWLFAREYYPRPSDAWMLDWHRGLGIGTAILSTAAVLADRRAGASDSSPWIRRILLWASAISVIAASHLGGLMVWGEDFLTSAPP